jgi:hypothetical protein
MEKVVVSSEIQYENLCFGQIWVENNEICGCYGLFYWVHQNTYSGSRVLYVMYSWYYLMKYYFFYTYCYPLDYSL